MSTLHDNNAKTAVDIENLIDFLTDLKNLYSKDKIPE